MLICFEGIDRAGKSCLSLSFLEFMNTEYLSDDGAFKVDPHWGPFIWTKEPNFPTEEASNINTLFIDEFERERLFFESHLNHQKFICSENRNFIFDRYIWTALTCCHYYSPNCFGFAKALYLSKSLFVPADLYIFIDTPPEVCYDRDPDLDLEVLKALKNSYDITREFIDSPIIEIQAIGGEDRALTELAAKFDTFIKDTEFWVP